MKYMANREELVFSVINAVNSAQITDIHTHLFSECFGSMFLYGIDELLTYHYLVAETMRSVDMDYDSFFAMNNKEQAECVWNTLFIRNTPLSEPARSIITIFNKLGIDVDNKDLNHYREYFSSRTLVSHIDNVFKIMGIKSVVMTNDPFDQAERAVWEAGHVKDQRFRAALRVDRLLNDWEETIPLLAGQGYNVSADFSGTTEEEVKRFLVKWMEKMDALYCAVSLPPDFSMNDGSPRARIIENCVLPVCREKNIPFALMIGVKRAVNPELRLAGDSLGRADIGELENLCSRFNKNKFLVTMLSLENQHELVVTARKFRNLMVFGCWWYLNSPTSIEFITSLRMEWLGTSFIPQHSDCRVFEQLISKWEHSKSVISGVLINKYSDLCNMGYLVSEEQIQRDVSNLFGDNFWSFIDKRL